MEEISSLDSFQTEGGDTATPRQDSTTPKLDEEQTESPETLEKTDTPKSVESVDADETAKKNSTNEPVAEDEEHASATNEDDFEQVSDGTFEVDDNSQETSTEPAQLLQDESVNDKTNDGDTETSIVEEEKSDRLEPTTAVDTVSELQENEESEDITVTNTPANLKNKGNEVDIFDQLQRTTSPDADVVDTAPSTEQPTAMDVDEDDKADGNVLADPADVADVEMQSTNSSPKYINDVNDNAANNSNADDGKDVVDGDEPEHDVTDDVTSEKNDDEAAEEGGDVEDFDPNVDGAENLEDDAEHGDEPVENVQEPEESDVCLIPDDTETQMTEADKEQAILARENAEKQELEEAAAVKAVAADHVTETSGTSENQGQGTATNETHVAADAQAKKQAGAEADADSKGGEESAAADGTDPNETDEQMTEEVVGATTEAGAVSKTIIAWVVSTVQTCKRCEEEKSCGFRVKQLEGLHEYEYFCDQSCCDALLKDNPGKYFIRRKKFLVEEVLNEESSITSASPTNTESVPEENEKALNDEPTKVVSNRIHSCLQCKETKQCKYFLKQEQDTFYICNDDCFNLLNVEEPDKFKLKRHSIRVRNIGATTISSADSPAKKSNESRVVARTTAEAEIARQGRIESFRRRCAECHEEIVIDEKHLLWETMDFCSELCLGKYQRTIGSNCQTCNGEVSQTALGKYCVRFGFEVRQFCCAACLNVFKKGLKTCSCCQKDISSGSEGFLAPVGDKEQFKDFCSQACLRRYDSMCNPKKKLRNDFCGVCNNEKTVRVEMILDEKEHYFCSNPCFSAFKFVSNVDADQCGMCCKYFERKGIENYTIYADRNPKVFCSRICINVYIIVNRHIVSCQWCKVKKYNFDMIYKRLEDRDILTCSLTCLSMYGVSMKAFSRAVTKCDQCSNTTTPQYHLTMSDASIRNFCTYQCVMQFQSQFARVPLTLENELPSSSNNKTQQQQNSPHSASKNGAPFPTGLPKRVKIKYNQSQPVKNATTASNNKKNSGPVVPVISTVTSLASGETEAMIGSVTVRRGRGRGRKVDSPPPVATSSSFSRGRPRKYVDYSTRTPSPVSTLGSRRSSIAGGQSTLSTGGNDYGGAAQTETKIITLPPYPATVRNVSTSCKPQAVSVGFQCAPETREIAVQTEKDYSNKILIPVPVPIYVPQPMYMYSAPFPVPVPIPLPIPVPIFIPTTRNSAQGILKEIKKIQERMPTDPLEAELLMMAEMVAEEKHDSDSDSDNEIKPDPGIVQLQYNNSVQQDVEVTTNNTYGEDVLQMALKMATGDDYDQQPTVDLESAMTANTISNPPPEMVGHDTMGHMNVHQLDQHMLDAQRVGRGRKRSVVATTPVATPARNNRSPVKRQRLQELDSPIQQVAQHSPQQHQPTEKPDANMCLKYTFGVNAWKQWVMTKNADIEKSSMRRRTFKTDLLQMTADELNYSLCLFVKEVRKPNGTEYAPDTIYYLVLGIQQYLYVNGRIDNIFYDPYYERFTECLDEVARKFSVLYNDSQYIVTRVEEEHLWECKQLGAHSPHVLLSTLMFFNTKHFNLTTVEEHMQLSFSHIMKHWKRSAQNAKMPGTRNVLLRFYPPAASSEANPRKKKVYEQQENEENPLRCPVRLYEFYLSKCPESVKTRNDVFYLQPERSCVPDSPVWYSTQALSQDSLQRMLHRVKMVKEINIALLTS